MPKHKKGVLCLTFLIYPSEDKPRRFVAHCLELDVVAVESNRPRAILLLKELITELIDAALADDTLEKIFSPAPDRYWKMLAHATPYIPSNTVRRHRIETYRPNPIKRVEYAQAACN